MKPADFKFLRAVLFIDCLIPAGFLAYWAATRQMGANPVDFFTRSTGTLTLVFLILSLAVTPLRKITGAAWMGKLRRMVGLFAFFYAFLHFVAYVWFDQFFALAGMARDVIERPFVTVGFAAFALMVPMAVTSTNGWIKRLGGKRWNRIHRRVYVVGILAIAHYVLLVKADLRTPVLFGAALAVVLGFRVLHAWVQSRARLTRVVGMRSDQGE